MLIVFLKSLFIFRIKKVWHAFQLKLGVICGLKRSQVMRAIKTGLVLALWVFLVGGWFHQASCQASKKSKAENEQAKPGSKKSAPRMANLEKIEPPLFMGFKAIKVLPDSSRIVFRAQHTNPDKEVEGKFRVIAGQFYFNGQALGGADIAIAFDTNSHDSIRVSEDRNWYFQLGKEQAGKQPEGRLLVRQAIQKNANEYFLQCTFTLNKKQVETVFQLQLKKEGNKITLYGTSLFNRTAWGYTNRSVTFNPGLTTDTIADEIAFDFYIVAQM
jgi:ribosomal protein S17E